jgi:hypothetical protein
MNAYILNDLNIITNIISVDSEETATSFNAIICDHDCYVIGETVAEGNTRKTELDIENARQKRNDLLTETDWWAVSDRTMTQEQIDYRQALRDLPSQEGFPDVNFPEKP